MASHSASKLLPACSAFLQAHPVQWSEDVIKADPFYVFKADPFFRRSRVRFRVPLWISSTIARDHLA